MSKLIINCPSFGHHEYLINTATAVHVQDKTVNDILKYYSSEAVIDFITIF
jgi:hypothetical protein